MMTVITISLLAGATMWTAWKLAVARAELTIERVNNELLHEDIAELRAEQERRLAPLRAANAKRSADAAAARRARMAIVDQRHAELSALLRDVA